MMKCKELSSLTTEYFERALGLADRLQFRLHIAGCPSCRIHVKKMEQLIKTLHDLPENAEIPDGLIERILNGQDS